MHRNSLPGGTRISLPAAMKLTMMERMSRKRVMSDGDYASDYWCIQVGRGGPPFYQSPSPIPWKLFYVRLDNRHGYKI